MPTGRWCTSQRPVDGSTELWSAGEDLEGEESPWEDRAAQHPQGCTAVADPTTEQSLEAGKRQGGNGHGDVVRLSAGNILRGEHCDAGSVQLVLGRLRTVEATVRETRRTPVGSTGTTVGLQATIPCMARIGSGMQQARDLRAEETVEVV